MFVTEKSASLLVSEVRRAWMENDASVMVLDPGSVTPDIVADDGGSQATCDRIIELAPGEVVGCGGNVDDEGAQKVFTEPAEPPKGVVLPKEGENWVWSRSSSFES
jgi:hypothetical protein